jgi:hypothetical protein
MLVGRFDRQDDNDDTPVYRLRWIDENSLTEDETRRLEFTRFLIRRGKLNEWLDLPTG